MVTSPLRPEADIPFLASLATSAALIGCDDGMGGPDREPAGPGHRVIVLALGVVIALVVAALAR